jgi:hypothetical protein
VVKALKAFGTVDAKVAYSGCRAVGNLWYYPENKKELIRIGAACDVVVQALKAFGAIDTRVADIGYLVVTVLSRDGEIKKELVRVGACDAVVKALKVFGTVTMSWLPNMDVRRCIIFHWGVQGIRNSVVFWSM